MSNRQLNLPRRAELNAPAISVARHFHLWDMQLIRIRQITRRNPFKIKKVFWIARVYAYQFDHWPSLGSQALFGALSFALFFRQCLILVVGQFEAILLSRAQSQLDAFSRFRPVSENVPNTRQERK
jgi:hypothetical protein